MHCEAGCGKWFHRECAGVSAGEFNILKSKNCCLVWFCLGRQANYKGRISKIDSMEAEIDTIKAAAEGNTEVKTTRIN